MLKGRIREDHIPLNKYELQMLGLPVEVTVTSITGLEQELDAVELPDRTMASGGQRGTSEIVIQVPSHHLEEIAAMEFWFEEGHDPLTPTYKKHGTLFQFSGTGQVTLAWALIGVFVQKRKIPDMSFENEGELSVNEYTLKIDDIQPYPV